MEIQTVETELNDDYDTVRQHVDNRVKQGVYVDTKKAQEPRERIKNPQGGTSECNQKESSVTSGESVSRRYPTRERRKPSHLKDFVSDNIDSDEIHTTID